MRRTHLIAVLVMTVGLAGARVPAQGSGEVALRAAMETETVKGDLKAAIAQYEKIVQSSDRTIAAKALIRMAECYEKLGDAQARSVFERIVRDYPDQRDAVAVARGRLAGADPVDRTRGDRTLWSGAQADGFGTISPDGRFLTYTDWAQTGGLILRELETGSERRLTSGSFADGQVEFSAISHDGRQVAYEWWLNQEKRYELRVAPLAGSGVPAARRIVDLPDARQIAPYDWSADGNWLAVFIGRKDFTGQIGIVGVKDGAVRILKSVDWKGPRKIFFSPDGRYLAYDLKVGEDTSERDVFVMAADGSRETAAVAHPSENTVMGWSSDGQNLLFASDRSGSIGLWAVPVRDGRAQGQAKLVKPDIGSFWSLGLTRHGTLYVWKSASPTYVQIASINLVTGTVVPDAGLQHFIQSRGRPDWSADGKSLAYASCDTLGGGPCTLLLRDMATGRIRELRPKLQYFAFPHWSSDGSSILTGGTDLKGRNGLYRINAQNGDAVLVSPREALGDQARNDGTRVYYRTGRTIVARDLTTGREQQLPQIPEDQQVSLSFSLSPDGRSIARITESAAGPRTRSLVVMPIDGGDARTLLRVKVPEDIFGAEARVPAWTPDGRALLVAKSLDAEFRQTELWLVPIDGSAPRRLAIEGDRLDPTGGFRLSPDGRRLAYVGQSGPPGNEIRALENILPALSNLR
jgi:Tol biopolymer transport system component